MGPEGEVKFAHATHKGKKRRRIQKTQKSRKSKAHYKTQKKNPREIIKGLSKESKRTEGERGKIKTEGGISSMKREEERSG